MEEVGEGRSSDARLQIGAVAAWIQSLKFGRMAEGELMTAIAREAAQTLLEGGGVEIRAREIGGGMTVSFIRVPAGWDLAPLLVGLPDDPPDARFVTRWRSVMECAFGSRATSCAATARRTG